MSESIIVGGHGDPYRVACDNHNEHRPIFTEGRPLLDDSCPWCVIDDATKAIAALKEQARLDGEAMEEAVAQLGSWQKLADHREKTISRLHEETWAYKDHIVALTKQRDDLRAVLQCVEKLLGDRMPATRPIIGPDGKLRGHEYLEENHSIDLAYAEIRSALREPAADSRVERIDTFTKERDDLQVVMRELFDAVSPTLMVVDPRLFNKAREVLREPAEPKDKT